MGLVVAQGIWVFLCRRSAWIILSRSKLLNADEVPLIRTRKFVDEALRPQVPQLAPSACSCTLFDTLTDGRDEYATDHCTFQPFVYFRNL